jgi:nitrogen fixation/metabolism regulation signal transduction histidine kinase
LNHIELRIIKAGSIHQISNSFKLVKVLYNATINSAENLKESTSVSNPFVSIEFLDKEIIVKDNGTGFPEKILNQLNRSDAMISTKNGGTGIGTAIIKDLVQDIGGKVKFYNDNGAVVHISFN